MRILLGLLIGSLFVQVCTAEEAARTWTSTAGTKIPAKLVKYSDYEVTLQLSNGRRMQIAAEKFSPDDQAYLLTKPDLKVDEPPSKLPSVRISARPSSRKKTRGTTYYVGGEARRSESRTKNFEITITSTAQTEMEVECFWAAVNQKVERRVERVTLDSFSLVHANGAKLKLQPLESVRYETGPITTTEVTKVQGNGGAGIGGSTTRGIIGQVYWNNFLIGYFASDGQLNAFAKDPEVRRKFGSARLTRAQALSSGSGGALGGKTSLGGGGSSLGGGGSSLGGARGL